MSPTIRGGGKDGEVFTTLDAWNYAFRNLCVADDRMEDPGERRLAAIVGVAWAKVAYLMERTEHTQEET